MIAGRPDGRAPWGICPAISTHLSVEGLGLCDHDEAARCWCVKIIGVTPDGAPSLAQLLPSLISGPGPDFGAWRLFGVHGVFPLPSLGRSLVTPSPTNMFLGAYSMQRKIDNLQEYFISNANMFDMLLH